MSTPVLSVRLTAGYGKETLLHDVALALNPGERLGLIGGSGAGKSTLLLAILGLLPWRGGWARGEVLVGGRNLLTLKERDARAVRGAEIALVPQSPANALNSALSLQTHFEQAWKAHRPRERNLLEPRLHDLLQRVRLPLDPEFLRRKPGQISVGQAQRAAIAMALLHRPSVLVADEPTSALDPVTASQVLQLLHEISREEGSALLYVSHDLLSVLQLCSRAAILHQGRLVEDLATRDLPFATHPYTRALLGSLPLSVETLLAALPAMSGPRTDRPFTEELVTPS